MHNWKNIIISKSATMNDAIQVLNKESFRIAMVVNDKNSLVGTVTDGDIRRALISHLSMDSPVSEFMFTKPTVAFEEDSKDMILAQMKEMDLLQIPILDKNNKVVGIETLHHLLQNIKFDNPVVLMAGGFGKRLKPLTDNIPKPLIKVGTKPILQGILEQFIDAGFYNFFISTHYKSEMVREFFGDGSNWNVNIKYIHEDKPLGTAGGLGLLPKNIRDLPILIMNGDLLTKVDFKELLNFHLKNGGDATMCVREYDFQVPYGVVKSKDHQIIAIEEKPKHTFFVNAGIYVLDKSMIKGLNGDKYVDMPNLIEKKINSNGQVNMFPIHEYWLDIGHINHLDQAQQDYNNL
jgi:dTDP-glucose pyrophosphorylase